MWAVGEVDAAWTIDANGREVHNLSEPGTSLVCDQNGSEELFGKLFGERFPPEQLAVAAMVFREGLRARSARKPTLSLPRLSTPGYVVRRRGHGGPRFELAWP